MLHNITKIAQKLRFALLGENISKTLPDTAIGLMQDYCSTYLKSSEEYTDSGCEGQSNFVGLCKF